MKGAENETAISLLLPKQASSNPSSALADLSISSIPPLTPNNSVHGGAIYNVCIPIGVADL
jgi:hypothetical protein